MKEDIENNGISQLTFAGFLKESQLRTSLLSSMFRDGRWVSLVSNGIEVLTLYMSFYQGKKPALETPSTNLFLHLIVK